MFTLKDLLYAMSNNSDNFNPSMFNYLNTNNKSFPEKYRHNYIYSSELYADIIKNEDEEFLNKKVIGIYLLSRYAGLDELEDAESLELKEGEGIISTFKSCKIISGPAIHIKLDI